VRFYPKLIPAIAKDIVADLTSNGHIEVEAENMDDAREDFASIMREYQQQEEALTESAKAMLIRRDWPRSKLAEAKQIVAAQRRLPMGDDGIDYVIEQMLEFLLISNNIEEVYAPDNILRRRIVLIMRKYQGLDDEVEKEVRARLKHLEEGTSDWEIQYKRVRETIRRNKGMI
jgi:hypothetical protein